MKIQRKIGDKHAQSMIGQFLHNPWSDFSQIMKMIYQHIFCSPNKMTAQSVYVRMQGEHLAWLCMQRHCMSTIIHDKCSCVHAHERIIQKITLENRIYVGSLSLKYEKDLLHGCGEVCLSLAMHVYLQFFFVFSAIFQVKVPSTRTAQNYDNPFVIFE